MPRGPRLVQSREIDWNQGTWRPSSVNHACVHVSAYREGTNRFNS
jgi:hypothetical protein